MMDGRLLTESNAVVSLLKVFCCAVAVAVVGKN